MGEVLVKIQPPDHPVHMPEAATFSPEVEAEIDKHIRGIRSSARPSFL